MMNKEELKQFIDRKFDEIFLKYQQENNIKSGDMFPEHVLRLEALRDQLATLVVVSMEMNKEPIYTFISAENLYLLLIDTYEKDEVEMLSFSTDDIACLRKDIVPRTLYEEIMKYKDKQEDLYLCFDGCGVEEIFRNSTIKEVNYISTESKIIEFLVKNKNYFEEIYEIPEGKHFLSYVDCKLSDFMDQYLYDVNLYPEDNEKFEKIQDYVLGDKLTPIGRCEFFKKIVNRKVFEMLADNLDNEIDNELDEIEGR